MTLTIPSPGLQLTNWRSLVLAINNLNQGSRAAGLSATGTSVTNALQLTSVINEIDTVGSGTGAILPPTTGNIETTPLQFCVIIHNGVSNLAVYGATNAGTTDTINGTAGGTGITQSAGAVQIYVSAKKGAWFSLSGTLTGDLVTTAGTQTLTNKTLTSPTVTGGTFTGGTSTNTMTGVGSTIGGVASGSYSQANSTPANVTGLTSTLAIGTYIIDGYLATTNNATGGIKLAFSAGGGLTASTFLADTWVYNTTTLTAEANQTSLAGNLVNAAVAATAVFFGGTVVVSAGGTITLQAAQNTTNGTPLTIANGSYITYQRIA